MKIYKLGPDTPYDEPGDDERYLWLVYYYEDIDGYSGMGEAVALGKDGLLYCYDLGHCSCYGPFDNWGMNCTEGITVEEFFRKKESIHSWECCEPVEKQIRKLI